jgi:hypothetical protein
MELTPSLEEFNRQLREDKFKIYPFLIQNNLHLYNNPDTFLEKGKVTSGVVYFESEIYNGGYRPKTYNNHVDLKISVFDVFNKKYTKVFKVPFVELEEAKKYNDSFGETFKQCLNLDE